jgi:hypothetical protein
MPTSSQLSRFIPLISPPRPLPNRLSLQRITDMFSVSIFIPISIPMMLISIKPENRLDEFMIRKQSERFRRILNLEFPIKHKARLRTVSLN